MAETFLYNIADSILGKITSLALQEVSLACGVRDELSTLHNTLSNVKAVILDAEEKQLTSHEIATWLWQLKNVLSEAEDVFDEFEYEALRKHVVNTRGGIRKKVRHFSSSSNPITLRLKMGHRLKEIQVALDEVAANKTKFHLNTHLVPNNTPLMVNEREMTYSFVHASDIIGRDKERDDIVKSLMDSSQGHGETLPVISVVGLGGLGKTALAKIVFNDSKIVEHFEKRVWVCLGDLKEFSINQVMVKIVKFITKEKSVDSDPEQLQRCLHDSLQNKRLLLVLDDVWVVDRPKWLELNRLLMCCSGESKVIITTRSSLVPRNMGRIILTQNIEGLPHGECVSLFKKFSFDEEEDDQNLMKIGDDIVRKCNGVPLAIKTVGSMLFSKRAMGDCIFVRDSEIWELEQNEDDILPALKLCYNQLSFILKQCFICCSIFPKDCNFTNLDLVQQWSAYGLLHSPIKTKKLEDIGDQYIKELTVRGFFQDLENFTTIPMFKMHDLIHDLALSLAKSEFRNMSVGIEEQEIYKRVKQVSVVREEDMVGEEVPKSFMKNDSSVRGVMPTIWCMYFDGKGAGADRIRKLVKICISKLKQLRILNLNYASDLEQLPNSIGTLRHLRYLNLSDCYRLKRLPNSITKLYNLQTLSLGGCEELEEVPKDIGDLINLKHLSITTKQKRLSANGIISLASLQFLMFIYCPNLEYIFESEGDDDDDARQLLTSLQILYIVGCRSLMFLFGPPTSASAPRKRSCLASLETLFIGGCTNLDLGSTYNDEISWPCLKSLMLQEMPQIESLPQWICPPALESLAVSGCPNLVSLPDWLPNLTALRKLSIQECPKLLCLPEGIQCLTALKELKIGGCPHLSRRCRKGKGEDWPNIAHIPNLDIESAPETEDENDEPETAICFSHQHRSLSI